MGGGGRQDKTRAYVVVTQRKPRRGPAAQARRRRPCDHRTHAPGSGGGRVGPARRCGPGSRRAGRLPRPRAEKGARERDGVRQRGAAVRGLVRTGRRGPRKGRPGSHCARHHSGRRSLHGRERTARPARRATPEAFRAVTRRRSPKNPVPARPSHWAPCWTASRSRWSSARACWAAAR